MSSKPLNILAVSSFDTVEGDVQTMLVALRGFDASFKIHAVSKPRGVVYERLKQIPGNTVFTMEMGGVEARPAGREGKPAQMADFLSAVPKVASLVKKHGIDVLYTIDRGVAPQLAALASVLTKRPLVLNVNYPGYTLNGFPAKFVLRRAAKLHGPTNYLLNYLKPHLPRPERYTIVPHGVEIERYDLGIDGLMTRRHFGVPQDSPIIAMMGRLDKWKGQDHLIEASQTVLEKYPDAYFLISGRGPEEIRLHLESLIAQRNVGHRVKLVGYVPSVPDFTAAATMVAMPSWEEPWGLVALEGMAMAKPVVSTRSGGVPEFVIDGEVGLLVPPCAPPELAKAILRLLDDPVGAAQMGRKGRARVEQHYTAQHYVRGVADAIRSVAPA
jgi:Glycosyltransferase